MKEIPLTQGYVALVDDGDYEELMQHKWCVHLSRAGACVVRYDPSGSGHLIHMHRQIMGAVPGQPIDHRNHNRLDNRRANIRNCTPSQNSANARKRPGTSSRYKGVSWDKRTGKWHSRITVDHCRIHLGRFGDEREAACAYNREARVRFKEFALLNDV